MATTTVTGSKPLTGSTYVDTWGNGSTYITSTQHYYVGYSNSAGKHRFSTCFKLTVPDFDGTATGFSLTLTLAKAVDNLSSRTYKVGVDRNTTNEVYQSGYYNKYGSWTNTVTATISSTDTTVTTTFSTSSLSPGDELYVYVYSGAAEYNTAKCTAVSGKVNYSYTETTDETGYEGVSRISVAKCTSSGGRPSKSSFKEFTNPVTLSPTPVLSGSKFYIRIYQLQYDPTSYTFYVYKKSSSWSFTGGNTNPSISGGTLIKTFTPTSSDLDDTGAGCYLSLDLPSSYFKIGETTSLAIIAYTTHSAYPNSRYGVGTAYTSDRSPQDIQITLSPYDWFYLKFFDTKTSVSATTAEFSLSFKSDNSPRYLNYVYAYRSTSGSTSSYYTGSTSLPSSTYKPTQTSVQMSATTGTQTKTITLSGLTPATTYKIYFYGSSSTTYANKSYYLLEQANEFTTDSEMDDYSATIEASVTGKTTTTINVTSLVSDTNLTGYYYAVKTDAGESVSSLSSYVRGDDDGIYLTGLTAGTSYTYYIYAQSSESGIFYKLNSVTFTTDANYTGTLSTVNVGATSATLSLSNLSSTTNLNGKWYISTVNNSNPVSSLAIAGNGNLSTNISVSGLTEAASNTLYAYVYSSASKLYYPVTSLTFTTNASSYRAGFRATGVTPTSAVLCMFNVTPTVNLSTTYYISSTNYGDDVSSIGTPVASVAFSNSYTVTGLTPGYPYTYYFYVYNTSTSTYRLVGDLTFTSYSSIIYRGENGEAKPYRVYKVNESTGKLEGLSMYIDGKLV